MRMSCNGCRVLRKGCSDNCSIRPCLEWIKSADAQANATVFLAKFYGRAGLMNLINTGPQHLRPAIFRSLLHEACGRIINPIDGSMGLLWSGSWNLCQDAVEAVLKGSPITQIAADAAEAKIGPALKVFDIRHVSKEKHFSGSKDLHRVRTRCRFKRSNRQTKRARVGSSDESMKQSPSHESSLSHEFEAAEMNVEKESLASAETAEPDHSAEAEPSMDSAECRGAADSEVELDLTLGLEPFKHNVKATVPTAGVCKIELGIDFPAS